jgi:hypothetical protein
MKLAQVSSRLADLSEQYEVPQKLGQVSEKVYEGIGAAGEAARKSAMAAGEVARRGAHAAYGIAREYPRASLASAVVAAALIGGALWYLFGDPKRPVERRRKGERVRAVSERRRRHARAHA